MLLRAIDTVLTRQALIVVRVRDALTERPPSAPAQTELFYRPASGEPVLPYPLDRRTVSPGLFVFTGDPLRAFQGVDPGGQLDLTLVTSAEGYEDDRTDFTLPADLLELHDETLTVDGGSFTVRRMNAPVQDLPVFLQPLPVALSGSVVEADDPDTAIVGATLSVTAPDDRPPVVSGENGFYTTPNLPVAREITVRVEAGGFQTIDETITLDYRQRVQSHGFRLRRQS